jgi:XTP/dITP diphosphohydrolase
MKQIYFITTNNYKFKKFSESVTLEGIEVQQLAKETPEIQAANNREVAEFSAEWVANEFNCPVIKEDVGMYIDALDGFPGPYLSSVEKQLKTDGFLKLLKDVTNRGAHWEYAVAFCEPGKKPVSFYTQHNGSIATEARGKSGWYADKLFILEGKDKTVAELLDTNEYVRNDKHYAQLKEYLLTSK